MISCVVYACIYDMVQTKIWHNSLKTVTRSWPQSNPTIHRCQSTTSSNYRRPHPWTRTSGTRDDLTPGLQLGLEPTTQALEVQRFDHYAMERSNTR